jgi:hypothetical protein
MDALALPVFVALPKRFSMRKHVFKVATMTLLLNLALCLSARAVVSYDRINVTSSPYSAIPNDTTADTTQIMAAINAVLPTPTPGPGYLPPTKSIYFPAGTYIFDGPMTLQANTAYRLYGDGPGISTIIFTGTNAGIVATDLRDKTLQIEGLTLQAGGSGCATSGTAIKAEFHSDCEPSCGAFLYQTATIRNVEVRGSDRTNVPANYWGNGISLKRAQNAVVEDVQIHGYFDFNTDGPNPNIGINWFSTNTYGATVLFLHNIYVKYYKTAISTSGWTESFRLSEFELFWCGYKNSRAAMELTPYNGNGDRAPVSHISDGHINQISSAIRMTKVNNIKISHVNFLNQEFDGTHLELHDCSQVMVANNDFHDSGYSQTASNGIYVFSSSTSSFSSGIIMSGNSFANMSIGTGGGSCVVVEQYSKSIKILDTLFDAAAASHKYANSAGSETAIRELP